MNHKMQINNIKNKVRGFTLIESLIAIVILITAIMAPLTLSLQISKHSRLSVMRMEASYMAEESIEIIHNLKKSAQIHCVDVSVTVCDTDYFDSYFLDPADSVIPQECKGFLSPGVRRYCNFDLTNLYADPIDRSVKLKNLNSAKIYVEKINDSTPIATDQPTKYKRSVNVTLADVNRTIDDIGHVSSIIVTSIVCINESGDCDDSSRNKIVLQNIISR